MMQTFTPLQYLQIDIANNYGLDKEDWNDRLAWFEANETRLLEALEIHNEKGGKAHPIFKKAEEPALFYAGLKAYKAAKSGEAISYPIGLDATASGAQLLALMVGCEKSAGLCNVIDTGHREDLYTNVYSLMCDRVGTAAKISRGDVKDAVMPSFYGSKKRPREVFGEGELLDAFLETMEEEASGIWELNKSLLNLWDPSALTYGWVMPDNFHVHVKIMDNMTENAHFDGKPYEVVTKINAPKEEGRCISANVTHAVDGMVVREVLRRCTYDRSQVTKTMELCLAALNADHTAQPLKQSTRNVRMVKLLAKRFEQSGFLSARIIEHIDETSIHYAPLEALWALLESMPENPFPVLSVHDCFRVHPNYGNDLRRQYNQILHDIAKSDILKAILEGLTGKQIGIQKYADISQDVLHANYALS